jgi:hypothetical protein
MYVFGMPPIQSGNLSRFPFMMKLLPEHFGEYAGREFVR